MLRLLLVLLLLATGPVTAQEVVRLVTFNIHHGEGTDGRVDLERVARVLRALKPDVVALQEVDRGAARTGGVDQLQRLAQLTGWHSAFGPTMAFDGGHYGNAILSRFPISDTSNHLLPVRPGQEPRAALVTTISPGNGRDPFHFVSTHFSHDREDARIEQATRLLATCRPLKLPVLIGGDFNARPKSKPMQQFREAGWIDQVHPHSKIDYILTRKQDGWKREEVRIIDDKVTSDHRPVLVTLRRTK